MKIKEITIGRSFKLSKNYNTCEASVFITVSLDDKKDNPEEVYDELSDLVNENLRVDIKEQANTMALIAKEGKF